MGDDAKSEENYRSAIAIFEKDQSTAAASDSAKRSLLKVLMKEEKRTDVAQLIRTIQPDSPKMERPDVSPQIVSRTEPQYPEAARRANLKSSGSVVISMDIDKDGHPQDLQVTGPLGLGFDENALAAVNTWTFKPATKNGSPVPASATVEVNFRIL